MYNDKCSYYKGIFSSHYFTYNRMHLSDSLTHSQRDHTHTQSHAYCGRMNTDAKHVHRHPWSLCLSFVMWQRDFADGSKIYGRYNKEIILNYLSGPNLNTRVLKSRELSRLEAKEKWGRRKSHGDSRCGKGLTHRCWF